MVKKKLSKIIKKIKYINIISKEANWSKKKARVELNKASSNGMPHYRYVKNECWKMTDEEITELNKKIKNNLKKRKEDIENLCNLTNWSEEKVKEELKKAKELNITRKQYIKYNMFELNDSEIKEFSNVLEELKRIKEENNQFYLEYVAKKSKIAKEEAKEKLEEAKKKGITYKKYLQNGLYTFNNKEIEKFSGFIKSDNKRIKNNKEKYIKEVMRIKNWSRGKTELEINKAKVNCGCSYEDYCVFKLYDVESEKQREYVTLDLFEKMRIKYNDLFIAREYFDDKAKFNETFADLIERRWFINENMTYKEFLKKIEGLDSVFVKPLAATQGIGIKKYPCNENEKQNKDLYDKLMKSEKSIIEEYIIQHPKVMKFCPTSVNTVRVTTLNYNGKCKFLYSVFRMGQGEVVDNFHSGGIAATVNMKTGVVCTDAADLDANVFEVNPYSKLKIKGFKIPNWDKIKKTCEKATGRVEGVNLIGWDFAVTEKGVELIEGNPGASYVVAQIPNVKNKKGLRKDMVDPYL